MNASIDLRSPLGIAVLYGGVSGAYILLSDRLVARLIDDPSLATDIQTAKGWLFVVGSSLLIFGLVARSQRSLEDANDRLDRALQQTSILHRILRHNLRNSCNVISGNTELLSARHDGGSVPAEEADECIETIREQTDQLVRITEKTRTLRSLVLEESAPEPVDLVALLEHRVDRTASGAPEATVDLRAPDTLQHAVPPRFEIAVDELLENAIEHSDHESPTVTVSLRQREDGAAVLEIADDGPGVPEMERAVLEEGLAEGVETPLFHSEGLGLWIVRTVVDRADGEVRLLENEPRGTVVRIVLP